jgi:serine/threonine-protein kinase
MSGSGGSGTAGRFEAGTILSERYRIISLLGVGGMGEVYRADDLKLDEPVALKFLPPDLEDDPDILDRFLAEVRLARQVSHRNICTVYDVGVVDGRHFLSMEYIDGEDLGSLLHRIGRMPTDKAVEIARQLCSGLSAAHERGILHRDLKPGNVMIDGRGAVRIADFGLASLAAHAEEGEGMLGTPAYLAPELLSGGKPSVQSDLYALGLVFYETFTGQPAVKGSTLRELFEAHRHRTPVTASSLAPDIHLDVEEVIERCLEKDPARRPPSAMAVLVSLPGGDPLAAARAAGETPSPELVAASGGVGTLSPAMGLAWLAVTLLGFLALAWFGPRVGLHGFAPLDQPPEVLQHRAREIIERFGFEPADYPAYDQAQGFWINGWYMNHMEGADLPDGRWQRLAAASPAAWTYWYRQHRDIIVPPNPASQVHYMYPPCTESGMINVELGPTGRLHGFRAVPGRWMGYGKSGDDYPDDVWAPMPMSTPDEVPWRVLFEEAGLDPADFRLVRPKHTPTQPTVLQMAWRGTSPEAPDLPLRIEAAFLGGLPTYFDIRWPEAEAKAWPPQDGLLAFADEVRNKMMIIALLAGVVLVVRNFRLARGDRRGAARLAWFVVAASFLSWLLRSNWRGSVEREFFAVTAALGKAFFYGGASWVLYLGLEPHVRRLMPERLISWNRLLAGRWRDPLVAHHVLFGLALAVVGALLQPLSWLAAGTFGGADPKPMFIDMRTYGGLAEILADVADESKEGVFAALVSVVLTVLLVRLLRTRWLYLPVFLALGAFAIPRQADLGMPIADLSLALLLTGVFLVVLFRAGLVAVAVYLTFTWFMTAYPLTMDLGAWHSKPTVIVGLLVLVLSVWGYRGAIARRTRTADARG